MSPNHKSASQQWTMTSSKSTSKSWERKWSPKQGEKKESHCDIKTKLPSKDIRDNKTWAIFNYSHFSMQKQIVEQNYLCAVIADEGFEAIIHLSMNMKHTAIWFNISLRLSQIMIPHRTFWKRVEFRFWAWDGASLEGPNMNCVWLVAMVDEVRGVRNVVYGMQSAVYGLLSVHNGRNKRKMIMKISPPSNFPSFLF